MRWIYRLGFELELRYRGAFAVANTIAITGTDKSGDVGLGGCDLALHASILGTALAPVCYIPASVRSAFAAGTT